jgi:hypothetical protein
MIKFASLSTSYLFYAFSVTKGQLQKSKTLKIWKMSSTPFVEHTKKDGKRTKNEGPVRIQYKCLVPIHVFPEMKMCGLLIKNRIIMLCLKIFTCMYL